MEEIIMVKFKISDILATSEGVRRVKHGRLQRTIPRICGYTGNILKDYDIYDNC
jgi:hypothetical protein